MAKRRYFKELRISQLRAMVELARCQGFTAAAAALDLTTPSVWQQIRAMEAEFGVPLVQTEGQQVTLTEHGRLLVELAEPIVHGFDAIRERFDRAKRETPKRLRIAAPGNVLVNELPAPIRDYREQYPDVELNLTDVPSNGARQLLEQGEVDLAVAGQLELDLPKSLTADRVTQFPFTLVCPRDHPLASARQIHPRSLARYPLVMSSVGTNSRQRVDDVFSQASVLQRLRIAFQTSTKELLLEYVRLGFGVAVVPISPRYRAKSNAPYGDTQGLAFRDLSRQFGYEQIVILRRRHHFEPAHQTAFREIVLASREP